MSKQYEQPHMWTYWRDKKGIKEALVDYYPETLKDDMPLKQALAQLENAERAINVRMEEIHADTPWEDE